ncbi:MAG: class I SAM-dependent methyltransferase, partial [Candidatus Dormibacteraceae bacterium]
MQQDDASIIGSIYDQFGDYYHRSRRKVAGRFANECIDVPAVLSLMPEDLSGKRVLDAGCGSGIYAQMIASRGASVTGVDASSKIIEIAEQEKPIDLEITYKVGDIGNLAFPDAAFDLVVCTYVLDNVGNLKSVFQEFHRLLKNQGICIFSISHPLRAQAARDALEG